jgi:hypothetical protein
MYNFAAMEAHFAESRRFRREKKTLEAMIRIYCHSLHNTEGNVCMKCQKILDYSIEHLGKCPYGVDKPACNTCPIHCYETEMRERIRAIMRYAGPKMLFPHPILSLYHLLDKQKNSQD